MQLVTGTVIGNMLLGLAGGDFKALARNLSRQAKGSSEELLQSSLAGWASSKVKVHVNNHLQQSRSGD